MGFYKQLAGKVIHRERPEGVDGWKLAFGEVQRVFAFAAVEGLPVGVVAEDGIEGFVARVCADAHDGASGAREEVVLQVFARAEEGVGFAAGRGAAGVDRLLSVGDARPRARFVYPAGRRKDQSACRARCQCCAKRCRSSVSLGCGGTQNWRRKAIWLKKSSEVCCAAVMGLGQSGAGGARRRGGVGELV